MPATDTELVVQDTLPDGFKNLFMEGSRLRRLRRHDIGELGDTVEEYSDKTLTEAEIIESVTKLVSRSLLTPERTISYPGLSLAIEDNLLLHWASGYKKDNDTPSGTIKNPERAGVDDIVFSPITPTVFEAITGEDLSPNWISDDLEGGDELNVIGNYGHDTEQNVDGESLQIGKDEQLFLTGDFIDLSQGQSIITSTQYDDIDGNDFGPSNVLMQSRHSGAHIMTTQATFATDSLELSAGVYDDGSAELVPIGFYLGPGRNVPSLI